MQENAKLLMEETGCEQGEAELALQLADNDLEKAIRTIGSLLRHIYAVKGKLYFSDKNLYGLVLIVINAKAQDILRLSTVISYNPALYENSPEMDWYSLEKVIFSYRLDSGSLPDYTQGVEEKLRSFLTGHRASLVKCDEKELSGLLAQFFSAEKVMVSLRCEELNLAQFRQMPDNEGVTSNAKAPVTDEPGGVRLEVDLIEDDNGKEAGRLNNGDVIVSQITDTRDIAHYLAHLIGGRRDGLPAVVKKVAVEGEKADVLVHYAPGIIGIARVSPGMRVKLLEARTQPWWKKIIPF